MAGPGSAHNGAPLVAASVAASLSPLSRRNSCLSPFPHRSKSPVETWVCAVFGHVAQRASVGRPNAYRTIMLGQRISSNSKAGVSKTSWTPRGKGKQQASRAIAGQCLAALRACAVSLAMFVNRCRTQHGARVVDVSLYKKQTSFGKHYY